ncbi:TonB-dependent receptor [Granulicella paludicola]|uniref:TonB-dependent receptor n=1 Tax=Granulicella paludicola TaxID=474951 RepID=UPI0021DF7A11|nr:TonB-dependent receptor [Granulicella paludicola]
MRLRITRLTPAPFFLSILFVLGLMLSPLGGSLHAQTNTTGLSGTVTDPSGALVPDAAVELSNPATGFIKVVKSGSKGEYTFDQILPAKYRVTVSAAAFAPQVADIELLVATPQKVNFKLTIGNTEVVDVAAGVETVNSTDATLGKAFNSSQVQNLPFIANNVNYLLSLQPGVLALDPNNPSSAGANTSALTGVVNGARNDQTNLTLDGVDNNDLTAGTAFVGILRSTRDSVQEFRVTTTNANADAGRSSGAQVSVATRSGTNSFHGSAYEYYRDPGIVANNWFVKQAALNAGKPNIPAKVLINTYGASFGAPIIKNKLFFFGAYEGYKYASDAVVTQTVPSVQNPTAGGALAGTNIGGLVTGNVVYPKCASAASCTSGTPYALTPTMIAGLDAQCTSPCTTPGTDSAAVAYMNLFPHSNANTAGDGLNTGAYTFVSPNPNHQITNVVRFDYNINDKQSLFFRGTLEQDNSAAALQFDSGPGAVPASSVYGNSKGFAVGHIWSVTPSLTNNFRYGFTRQNNNTQGAGAHPNVSFSAFANLTGTTKNSDYILVTNNFVDDATWVRGKHVIQFGVNDRLITNNRYSASTLYSTAGIQASALAAAKIAGTGGDLDPTAVYGAVQTSAQSNYNNNILANVGGITTATTYTNYSVQNNQLVAAPAGTVPHHIYKSFEQEYYISDQWKATERLTITAGLRYLYLGVPYEENGQQIAPSINLGGTFFKNRLTGSAAGSSYSTPFAVQAAGQANGQPNLYTPQKGNFAPRLAFAWATPDNKTSVRGGFALAYDHFGSALIDAYDSGGAFALSFANGASYPYPQVTPRFTSYLNTPSVPIIATSPEQLPIVNPNYTYTNFNGSFVSDINQTQKTPYAETFNLSVQREVTHGLTVTLSYVGRLGHHTLENLDVAEPNNLYDAGSNQTYFQAVTAYDKMIAAGVPAANVAKSGYFQNVFPNASYTTGGVTYTGAQAYYASLISDAKVGNETNTLYLFDVGVAGTKLSTASPKGPYQFFFPEYSSIFVNSTIGNSNYNALQASVRHVFKHGNEYDFNYTLSKSMDQGSSPESASSPNRVINAFSPSQMYAVSDYDVRHLITGNYNMSLPFGKGQRFLSTPGPILDRIISGWQLNGTMHYNTGFPWSAADSGYYGTDFASGSYAVQTAPLATGKRRIAGAGTAAYVTSLKSATPAQGAASFRTAYPGETGQRNELRYNGYLDFDDGLSKSFRTYHDQTFKLTVEVFNVMNNVVMGAPTTSINSAKFGNYTAIQNQPRQFQFSGKYNF